MAKVFVTFNFKNKKGETKRVIFPMDRKSYEVYHDPSVPKEWTEKMMLEEYRDFCAEQKYQRRTTQMPVDDEGREIDIPDDSPTIDEVLIEKERMQKIKELIAQMIQELPKKQQIAFTKVHLENKKPCVACKEMNIKKNTFSELLSRAEENFKKVALSEKYKKVCEIYELLGVEKAY